MCVEKSNLLQYRYEFFYIYKTISYIYIIMINYLIYFRRSNSKHVGENSIKMLTRIKKGMVPCLSGKERETILAPKLESFTDKFPCLNSKNLDSSSFDWTKFGDPRPRLPTIKHKHNNKLGIHIFKVSLTYASTVAILLLVSHLSLI